MSHKEPHFAFFGTPDVAADTLKILKQNGYMPELIITSPDKRSGRGLRLQASPAAVFASENGIPCLKPDKLDQEFISSLKPTNYDLFIVVAYGKMIPENMLNMTKLGSINIHYSLLPKYRGASPVESAILNGDTETGVTIQEIEYKMDTGPILAQEKVEIESDEKAPELRKRLIIAGAALLIKTLPRLIGKEIQQTPQNEKDATHSKKIKKEDGLVNLEEERPDVLYNKFRAYASWPRIYFFKNGKRMIITKARLENGKFVIEKIIPENGKETDYKN